MMGHRSERHVEVRGQIPGRQVAVLQQMEDATSRRIGEGAKGSVEHR